VEVETRGQEGSLVGFTVIGLGEVTRQGGMAGEVLVRGEWGDLADGGYLPLAELELESRCKCKCRSTVARV